MGAVMAVYLNQKEREIFAAYCEEAASSYSGMLEHMKDLPDHITKHFKAKVLAYSLVAAELKSAQEMSVERP